MPPHKSPFKIFWEILCDDDLLKLLLYVATFSLVISFFSNNPNSSAASYSIYMAVLFLLLVQTVCSVAKEKQFRNLYKQMQNQTVQVIRGPFGLQAEIPSRDLVVGDIILLNQGDSVPADCILIEEMDMFCDESFLLKANARTEKQCLTQANIDTNPDPLLFQGSLVLTGAGKAVVCAVGERTFRWSELKENEFELGDKPTPMQNKLEKYGDLLSKYAFYLSLFVLFVLTIYQMIELMASKNQTFVSKTTLFKTIENIQITIALLIVCVPEGLPLAISISIAFSLDKLIDRSLMIRELEGLEVSGQVLDVLTGCSCLYEGKM